ncbi:MAG: hypothetical protein SVS85_03535 [Candidatus Nanohaloarchaea archaeon]|nr:hypothetical protein [Candidatus Nanohaloarchaea archaeon]
MRTISKVFSDRDWREHLDREIVRKLEKLLKRVKTYESAYKRAGSPKLAQLWVGLAELFYQQERVNARLRKLERKQEMLIEGIERNELGDEELRDSLNNY